jgi:hypothetical protein
LVDHNPQKQLAKVSELGKLRVPYEKTPGLQGHFSARIVTGELQNLNGKITSPMKGLVNMPASAQLHTKTI